ncbi:MAG TPA: glycosyltransferase family 92 protein [Chlamydiales bacterium]|nr:glycosyltransferase family 92 protein [Chlamydiales bacterium]
MHFLLFLFCAFFLDLAAEKKKYNFCVCALFKNESRNIREWIEYHRLIGVDHFYLYENSANDGFMKVLRPYINRKLVTLIPWPDNIEKEEGENLFKWSLSTQVPAYENAIVLHAKKEAEWLVFLDIDEFILPVEGTMTELLEQYRDYSELEMDTEFFEAARSTTPTKNLVIESVDITKPPKVQLAECVKKSIFKPEKIIGSQWAPYRCLVGDQKQSLQLDKNIVQVNRYLNRNKRTIETKRKLYIDQRNTKSSDVNEILNSGYDIEDQQRVIYRFVPEVMRRLSAQY